ncbi:MAG TPA: PP2C family protein-serine/threonine phosphatase [Jatrophihabitans sp.]|nr:PP2C family protein-serine/threonine phosphatase [Jatrophihabitans sp.]
MDNASETQSPLPAEAPAAPDGQRPQSQPKSRPKSRPKSADRSQPMRRVSRAAVAVLVISAALTAGLSVVAYRLNQHNEHRLLNLQVKETATLLQALLPGIETPLASAAEVAATSDGSAAAFQSYVTSYVGTGNQFDSASLWVVNGQDVRQVAVVGVPPALAASPDAAVRTLKSAAAHSSVTLVGPFGVARPRLGYVYAARHAGATYVAYAESALPAHKHAQIQRGSPFSDLRFALYLGGATTPNALLETNEATLPVAGDTARTTVPFGSSALTLVAGSTGQLGGALSGSLWWIVALIGAALSIVAMLAADRLVRGRKAAERLTAQTEVLLAEQRGIARKLQDALLPEVLPTVPGLRADARYVAGAGGVDIGGDWYDLLPVDDRRVFFVIGDVSGRGLAAATTMAALRFAIHGFVSEHHEPAAVLDRLSAMVAVGRDGQFATVLCGVLDVATREMTLASAGHLPPLVIGDGTSAFAEISTGPPIGVPPNRPYQTVTVRVPPRSTLLAFTDGLVERRGETLDVSLARLRSLVGSASSVQQVFELLTPNEVSGGSDDIAILGVQWLN